MRRISNNTPVKQRNESTLREGLKYIACFEGAVVENLQLDWGESLFYFLDLEGAYNLGFYIHTKMDRA